MKIDILTLFPSMFEGFLSESIIKKAISSNLVDINIHNIRNYSTLNNKQVDDYPFGGGAGMLLMCDPVFRAIDDLKKENSKVIMMSPQGEKYGQEKAYDFSREEHIIILCGHYEGFDERIRTIIDVEISVGDYILTGGEIPSMIVVDSIVRLVDGVIDSNSLLNESFNGDLLDHPNYTRPREYRGLKVPDVLLSGNHKEIAKYRLEQAIEKTKARRPDLLDGDVHE